MCKFLFFIIILSIVQISFADNQYSWKIQCETKKFPSKFVASQHELAAHQFIAVQDLFGQQDKWVDNLHKIMAALAVKYRWFRKSEIKPTEFDAVAEMFKNKMSIANAYAYALFFSAYFPELLETTRQYLETEVEKLKRMTGEKTGQQSNG